MNHRSLLRACALASFIAAVLLAIQFVIGISLGSDLALLETALDANAIASFLRARAPGVMTLMAFDNLFVVAYSVAFVGLALALQARARLVALSALGLALLTSASDLVENSLIVALTRLAQSGAFSDPNALLVLNGLTQLKFLWIYVGGVLFALTAWDQPRLNRLLALLLLLFPLVGAFATVSILAGLLRFMWMLILLLVGGLFLWRASR